VWLLLKDRLLLCAVMFALAVLAKETAIVFAAGIGFYLLSQRKIGAAFGFGAIVLIPFIILQIGLYAAFGSLGVGSGGGGATGFEFIPFMGVIRILTEGNITIFAALMVLIAPFVLFPTLWGLWRCWRDFRNKTWSLYTWLLLLNSAIMLFVPFSTYRETNAILRFIAGLMIAVILYAAHKRNRQALRYSTLWAITLIILVYSDIALVAEM
jgi:uncharacterized membrane protein